MYLKNKSQVRIPEDQALRKNGMEWIPIVLFRLKIQFYHALFKIILG